MEMQLTLFNHLSLKRGLLLICLILLTVLSAGCKTEEDQEDIKIFAASSLTDAVRDIEEAFEASYEDIDLKINFAGSKTLRTQLENGAQADLFLSANEAHYRALVDQGILLEGCKLFSNEMVVVVSEEAFHNIQSLEDLQKNHRLILGDLGVPAGDYSREIIANLSTVYGEDYEQSVLNNLVSSESNVRQVLMKVVLGEGDAAIVYKTDVSADIEDKVTLIEIPEDYNVIANYWMGVVNNGMISESVDTCYQFLLDDKSCEIFEKYGFSITE